MRTLPAGTQPSSLPDPLGPLAGRVFGPVLTGAAWDAAVARLPGVTPYQRFGWVEAWAAGVGGEPVFVSDPGGRFAFAAVLTAEAGGGLLYVPRGPVGRDRHAVVEAAAAAAELFPAARVRVGPYLAWDEGGEEVWRALTGQGFVRTGARWHDLTAIVPLDGEERVLRRMSGMVRRGIARAQKAAVTIRRDNSPDAAASFYDLYAAFMADKVARLDPRRFFLQLIARFDRQDLGTLLFAHAADGSLASAALVMRSGRLAWLSRAPRPFGVEPHGAYVQWEAMRWAMAQGCQAYDLGGIEADESGGPRPTGLTFFKRSLGGSIVRIVPELERAPR